MKHLFLLKTILFTSFSLFLSFTPSQAQTKVAISRDVPLSMTDIIAVLTKAPMEFTALAQTDPLLFRLPLPDGNERLFKVVESPIMDAAFAALYPTFKTYSLVAADNPQVTGRITVTPYGLNAFIFLETGTMGIRPRDLLNPKIHQVYTGSGDTDVPTGICEFDEVRDSPIKTTAPPSQTNLASITNGTTRRTYRLAIVTTGEFTANNGGTAISAAAVVTASVNAIQAIYDRELSVRFTLLTPVTYTDAATDPFTSDNSGGDSRPNQAAEVVNINFMSSTYDIGHVLHNSTSNNWSGGGVAGLGVVCSTGTFFATQTGASNPNEPDGLSGFDRAAGWSGSSNNTTNGWYGLFAHEVGHMFNMPHTFNGTGGSCTSSISSTTAYEIGSGNSLMSYNGICSAAQNIPDGGTADDYFHANSLDRAVTYMGTVSCQTSTSTGNTPPVVNANPCGGAYTIPTGTPFTLTGSGTDANGDVVYYSWEQYDEDGVGTPTQGFIGSAAAASAIAPLFRSYPPITSPSRTFPIISAIVANTYATDFEPLPTVARTLNFRLTGRDYNVNGGGIHSTDMAVTVSAVAGGAFSVTAPNGGESIVAGATTTVTWTTNTTSFCTNVNIKMSIDGGYTYPYTLATNVSNAAGSQMVTIPAGVANTSSARMKVECADNICVVFFDISNTNFTVTSSCAVATSNICSATAVSFAQGNAGLNLGLNKYYGGTATSTTVNITGTDPIADRAMRNSVNGTTCTVLGTRAYKSFDIAVATTGTYTLNVSNAASGFIAASVFASTGFNPSSPCSSTFLGSNAYDAGGGSAMNSSSFSVTLTACTQYKVMVYSSTNAYGNTTISFSGSGDIYLIGTDPGGSYAYTYVAVNTVNSQVVAISATSDFTTLGVGVYNIYGASYKTDVNTAAWTGLTLSQILSGGDCVLFSSNLKLVTVVSILPVELLNLQATPLSNTVKVTWQTATETNNKGFQVERRQATGDKWDVLGFVATKGKASSYQYIDDAPLSTNYYRLRQIDEDGKERVSKIVTATLDKPSKLKAYPNPVAHILTIETSNTGDFQIINLLGQQVLRGKVAQRIDVSVLPQGTYILKIGTEQAKFMKQ